MHRNCTFWTDEEENTVKILIAGNNKNPKTPKMYSTRRTGVHEE